MGSRGGGGGGSNGGGSQGIPAASRRMIQSLKEIVNGVPEAEIYSTLKDCNMDPNEAVNRLLSQDTFHEVKSKREKKKELKDTTESRPRGGGSTSNRGARSGTDRYSGRSGSTQFSSSESGGSYGKPTYKRENGTNSFTTSTPQTSKVTPRNANWHPPSFSDSHGHENEVSLSAHSAADVASVSQPSSGYQSAWLGAPGQKSMADIVKMGKPQNKGLTTSYPAQQSTNHNFVPPHLPTEDYSSQVPEIHPEYNAAEDNEWPSIEQPQSVDTHTESGMNLGQSNLQFERNNNQYYETNEVEEQDESSSEDQIEDTSVALPLHDNDYHPHDDAGEDEEVEEEDDAPIENIQKLSIKEEKQIEEEDGPSVVIPDHLQVHTADCSHLSFGSFGANMNSGFSGPFASSKQEDTEPVSSSVEHSETTNLEYYEDESSRTLEGNLVQRPGSSAENYDLKQDNHNPEVTYGFPPSTHPHTFDTNPSFPQPQTSSQTQISTPFLNNVMQAAQTNSLPSTLLAANVRESDLSSYSQFSRYANSASSISDPTMSMAEALKSSAQPPAAHQSLPTGPGLPQHLAVHPYSQHLGPFANMFSYPFLPQSYTYMPSGFQPTFAGNSTYHQQLAAILPQYKNSLSVSSLPQSGGVASGYGSTPVPGNYPINQPAGSNISYEDVLNAHYKDQSQLLSLQQNENSPMWVHGGGSRTMPASAYYSLQSQQQHQQQQQQHQQQQGSGGFRQGQQQQQPSQSYGGGGLNYPDFFHSQEQNPRDGGSQGQPKLQSQQLWQNGY